VLEDFRKIAVHIAGLFMLKETSESVEQFVELAVQKSGVQRLRDFMEIQLMHYSTEYHHFMKWFDGKHGANKLELPAINKAVPAMSPGKKNHSHLYNEKRAQRKVHKAEEESSLSGPKHQEIIDKINMQLRTEKTVENVHTEQTEEELPNQNELLSISQRDPMNLDDLSTSKAGGIEDSLETS
jgi:hypothetical protein